MPRTHSQEYATRTEKNAVRIYIRAHSWGMAINKVD